MIDLSAATLSLRNRALGLVVATTGSTDLSATATGYHRAAGSFVTDGFLPGMEFTPTGFAANTVDIITSVTATDIATKYARAVEAVASGRTLSVGLPLLRAFENYPLTPVSGRPYIEEEFVPGGSTTTGVPANGAFTEETGLYVIKWYGLINLGIIPGLGISTLRKQVDALKSLFAPGTTFTAGSNIVRVRRDHGPYTGQIIPLTGWAALVLTVPWHAYSTNQIAA